jgi:hypothetical protein
MSNPIFAAGCLLNHSQISDRIALKSMYCLGLYLLLPVSSLELSGSEDT